MILYNVTNVHLAVLLVLLYIELTSKVRVRSIYDVFILFYSVQESIIVTFKKKTVFCFFFAPPPKMGTFSTDSFCFFTVVMVSESITSTLLACIILSYMQKSVFQKLGFSAAKQKVVASSGFL